MNWGTLLKSVEFWNYLPIKTLARLLQCNRALYWMLRDKQTWRVLITRDFGIQSEKCSPRREYQKISSIIGKFEAWPGIMRGKSLTTDALKMILHFYPTEFHNHLLSTGAFYDAHTITTHVLVEATQECVSNDCSDFDEIFQGYYCFEYNTRAFLDKLRTEHGSLDGTLVHILH